MYVFYDKITKFLVCMKNNDPAYWDNHWHDSDIAKIYKSISTNNMVNRMTRRYVLPQDGPVLEGGCGMGQFVFSLSQAGYECIGIDTAEKTIKQVKKTNPQLDVRVMSVDDIDFPDNHFAAYWSLGVIEHFPDGYDKVLDEMFRVIKPQGFVFVSVPVISWLRRLKINLGLYKTKSDSAVNTGFYQFILPWQKVVEDFKRKGFKKTSIIRRSGIKGLRDELPGFERPLRYIESLRNKNFFFKLLVEIFERCLSPMTGHISFFVFQKPVVQSTTDLIQVHSNKHSVR